ncbi:PKD domain-containing protein [Aeromicrobium sp.]|uniref:PKD domain-containing protein n=1 Tax=Aeromicrobium sp. TaxID=1871063 RepID=UPI001998CC7A|nr:PKD domain-containing protein [Aeromicrobium sp.]MBC7632322.1 PKD domain-containing protein [Aeromicrobium sp.]
MTVLSMMIGLVVSALVLSPSVAQADTAPATGLPETASADALPTAQINGVAWDQAIVGNTVYVVGSFTNARPAGSAAGVNTVTRNNMLAYNLTTGELLTGFAPSFNAEVRSVAASPDGSRIYVGGAFTSVSGLNRYRVAALNPTTGAVIANFAPVVNSTVKSVTATATGVYFGGQFSSVGGSARTKLAAVNANTGALLPWSPSITDGIVQAVTASPDGTKIVAGGSFTFANGSNNPGYGLVMLDSTSGTTNLPMSGNAFIRNGGSESAILSLKSDADGFYGSGYHFGGGGNVEGSFQIDWNGNLAWVEDCHGDTYDIAPAGDVVYSASHKHYCGNIGTGGYPQTDPWSFKRATATTKFATGTSKPDIYGYPDHAGQPSPTMLNFFPDINTGSYTGAGQGPWTVEANSQYVVFGGEFTRVNGGLQQGLVRLATKAIAPNKSGPRLSLAAMNPSLNSYARGTVSIGWPGNWDRDNSKLTYKIYRGDTNTVVYEGNQDARFWETKRMRFVDKTATPGSATRYRVQTIDPFGNFTNSEWVTVDVAATGELGDYGTKVLEDGAANYWRLGESNGPVVNDWAGADDTTAGAGVTRGTAGALLNSDNLASTFDGSGTGFFASPNSVQAPDTFTTEAWFKTTSTSGGKIVGYGNSATGNSSAYDRHTYMDGSGRVFFGVYTGNTDTVSSSRAYNDGQWHQVVSSLSSAGMALYIDGKKVGSRTDVTAGQSYSGYWRVGGDSSWAGNNYFTGDIDDVSVYPTALSTAKVNEHWIASGRSSALPPEPTDAYGKKVFAAEPDLYWRLDDTSGTIAKDSSAGENDGTYRGTVDQGAAGIVAGNSAVKLGSGATVVANGSTNNPTTFSEEVWIKTGTSQGGRIFGFGRSGDGNFSSSYDRHMYMLDDGTIRFGVYNGNTVTIDSQAGLNDNAWHHVVATVGSNGMKLYVDGDLKSSNGNTQAENYPGYWRLGGDQTWGGNSSSYFDGYVDEAAIYSKVLTPEQVTDHYTAGEGVVPNIKPTAAFTPTVTDLKVLFDGTGSSDSDGTVASYDWTFGDGTTSTSMSPEHTYAQAGGFEVTLKVTDDDGATDTISKTVNVAPANVKPTAAFMSTTDFLKVTFDGTGSSDSDGTVASYAWEFGDGSTSTLGSPEHSYTTAGDKTVKLTVTDDDGATDSVTKTVTVTAVPPANVKPTAAFMSTTDFLKATFDGTGSSDSDGTVASYAWEFGDGGTSTATSPSHTYTTAGDKTVKLTVTDNDGATDSVTKTVTVTAVPAPSATLAEDAFGRNVANGFGSADKGGAWTVSGGNTSFAVDGSKGVLTLPTAGSSRSATLGSVSSTDTDLTAEFSLNKVATGGGTYVAMNGRSVNSTNLYRAKAFLQANSDVKLLITKVVSGTETTVKTVTLIGVRHAAGDTYGFRFQVTGTGTTTLKAKLWNVTTSEPTAWTNETSDTTAALQANGGVGFFAYTSGSSTNAPQAVTFDNLVAKPVSTVVVPNVKPTAAFTSTTNGLAASFNGAGSSDSDGTVASYAWSFGDGGTSTEASPAHTYTTAGDKTVTLTVTDDDGATDAVTKTVTVTAPAPTANFAADTFGRNAVNAWGAAQTGGSWTTSGGATSFSVNGSKGVISLPTAGSGRSATLSTVSSDNTDLTAEISMDKIATGGGTYVALVGRSVNSTNNYRLKVWLRANADIQLLVTKVVGGSETTVRSATITGVREQAGDVFKMRFQVSGTGATALKGKVWKASASEPASWAIDTTDTTAVLQVKGAVGVYAYSSGSSTNAPLAITVDNVEAKPTA